MLLLHRRHGDADVGNGVEPLLIGCEVEGNAADALLLGHQVLVHIVPVLVVVLQKIVEIRFILNDEPLHPLLLQQGGHGLDAHGGRIQMQLQPIHGLSSLSYAKSGENGLHQVVPHVFSCQFVQCLHGLFRLRQHHIGGHVG